MCPLAMRASVAIRASYGHALLGERILAMRTPPARQHEDLERVRTSLLTRSACVVAAASNVPSLSLRAPTLCSP